MIKLLFFFFCVSGAVLRLVSRRFSCKSGGSEVHRTNHGSSLSTRGQHRYICQTLPTLNNLNMSNGQHWQQFRYVTLTLNWRNLLLFYLLCPQGGVRGWIYVWQPTVVRMRMVTHRPATRSSTAKSTEPSPHRQNRILPEICAGCLFVWGGGVGGGGRRGACVTGSLWGGGLCEYNGIYCVKSNIYWSEN